MNHKDKLDAIFHLLNHDGAEIHFGLQNYGFGIWILGINDYQNNINMQAIDSLFNCLAYKEYLKKKAEFLVSYSRDKLGRFKSNKK